MASNEDAVCRALGYKSAVMLSSGSGNGSESRERGAVTMINASGERKAVTAYVMQQIHCLN